MFLPYQVSHVDRLERLLTSAPAGADGLALVTFPPVGSRERWLIDRVAVSCTSTTKTTALLFTDRVDPREYLDGSNSGNRDTADNTSPLQIDSGRQLLVQWSGCSAGAVATCRVQGRIEHLREP